MSDTTHDVFVCHASADKARLVEPLVAALYGCGLKVWLDRFDIRPGDEIGTTIDRGLVGARFAVVVISPQFWTFWTEQELSGLHALESADAEGRPRMIPVWAGVNEVDIATRSPRLAARRAIRVEAGIDNVARQIADHVRAVAPRPLGRSPSYGVPKRRAQTFVGREHDVAQVIAALEPGGRVSVAAAVEGLAGVGKTELALHVVDRLTQTSRFPGGIYWLEAEQRDLTPIWGGDLADCLELAPGPIDARARAALRRISSEGPSLVVLDNVNGWTSETMPAPLPEAPRVALLVTTRHRNLGGGSFRHVAVECLAAPAAHELLAAISNRVLDIEPGADALLQYLDGHTLAIELAGAFLREVPEVSAAAYLQRLRTGDAVEQMSSEYVRYARTAAQAFAATCERLDEDARHGLLVAGCFADDEASIALLDACGVNEVSRAKLRRFHLIRSSGERWTMHRLVREYARVAGTNDELESGRVSFVNGALARAQAIDAISGLTIYLADRAHFARSTEIGRQVLASDHRKLGLLFAHIGTGARSAGDLPLARLFLEQALSCTAAALGDAHPLVAHGRADLAQVLLNLGDSLSARALLEHALNSSVTTFGDGHAIVAARRAQLARALQAQGDLPRSCDLLDQAVVAAINRFGEGHPTVATIQAHLAVATHDLGEPARAREILAHAIGATAVHDGSDHPNVATMRAHLGSACQALGDFEHSRRLFERALAAQSADLGDAHPVACATRTDLALVFRDLGDHSAARHLLEQSLGFERTRLGADHPAVGWIREHLRAVRELQLAAHTGHTRPELAPPPSDTAVAASGLANPQASRPVHRSRLTNELETHMVVGLRVSKACSVVIEKLQRNRVGPELVLSSAGATMLLDDGDPLCDDGHALWKLKVPPGDHVVHVVAAGNEWGESWSGYEVTASIDVIFVREAAPRQSLFAWVAAKVSNSGNPKDPWPLPTGSLTSLADSDWFEEEIRVLSQSMITPRMAGLL